MRAALAPLRAPAAEGGAPRPLVVVHVRCKADTVPLEEGGYRACGETHAGTDGKWAEAAEAASEAADNEEAAEAAERVELPPGWRDEGVFWSAPLAWYASWLRATLPRLDRPALLLCADDPARAAAGLAEFAPALLPPLLRAQPALVAAAHAACGGVLRDGALEMLCDWESMRCADVLATAASTFSFTAAMLAAQLLPPSAPPSTPPPARFWRPDPAAGAIVEYEPWAAAVLLNACTSGTNFRQGRGSTRDGGG